MKSIDNFLNGVTMYRLVLYVLVALLFVATILSFIGLLAFNPFDLLFSVTFLTAACWITNTIFSKVFKVPTNLESVYITALILALIITPNTRSLSSAISLSWVAVLSEAGKYIFAINKKHIFNPAALAVLITAIFLNYSASWWVGTTFMTPFVLIGGLLIVRKIRRFNMVFSFLGIALFVILGFIILKGNDIFPSIQRAILETPVLFFSLVMLTEPQTTPPTKNFQMIYGGLVGLLFYLTPGAALLIGNVFSYIVSPKNKLILKLRERIQLTPDTYDFVFEPDAKLNFSAGQYLELTLGQHNPDSRGSRRYLTIASSPTEETLRFGIKFYVPSSSFKKSLISLNPGNEIIAAQLSGEFTLPKDLGKKLVFIAGGIGVTPFRSIIKYLLDTNQRRDIVLFYANKTPTDVVYKNIFDEAYQKLSIKTTYVCGPLQPELITKEAPDFLNRFFYISGPHGMIDAFEGILKGMGVPSSQIKIDFFPGYA